eukprot:2282973-Karenia_brevis.AAC.1
MEICGGVGGVSKLAVRRHLCAGTNFDLRHGVNLLDPSPKRSLWKYICDHKPLIIIMAPPCTAFANWSRLNRVKYPSTWHHSWQQGLALA